MIPVPERPIDWEVLEHIVTHSPAKPWCPHCVKGTTRNDPHKSRRKEVPDVEVVMGATPTISIDLMYLYDKIEGPTLVAIDHESGRVWSHALKGKTIVGGTGWIQNRLAQDIGNAGHKNVKRMIKSHQEKSMVALQHEVQRLRDAKAIPVNSPLGESECNGRVENTIGRVQDKTGTLKSHIEAETGIELDNLPDLMSWVVGRSGELITRYHIGSDKRTAYERIRGKPCNRPICQIGESMLHLPLDSPKTDDKKCEPKMREGIWLGTSERTEENLIGTSNGVVKCPTAKRRPESSQWNARQLNETIGSVQAVLCNSHRQ